MNVAQLFTFYPQLVSTNPTNSLTNKTPTNESFNGLLQLMMEDTALADVDEVKVREPLISLEEIVELLLDELPFNMGYVTEETLMLEEVKDLLMLLPLDLKLEIQELFEKHQPLEVIVNEDLPESINLITFILALRGLEVSNEGFQKQLQATSQQLQLNYPSYFLQTEETKSFKQVIESWIEQLKKEDGIKSIFTIERLLQKNDIQQEKLGMNYSLERQFPQTKSGNNQNLLDVMQPLNRIQQFTIHVGETLTKQAQEQQFTRQFKDILSRSSFTNDINGMKQITIRLFPEHLGRVDVQLLKVNGVIQARLVASSHAAKELIESQIQQLRVAFGQQQLQVDRIEITHQQNSLLEQQMKEDNQKKQHRQRERDEISDNDNEELFVEALEQVINEKV